MYKIYTTKETAEMLRISVRMLSRIRRTGEIVYNRYTPRGSVFYEEDTILEHLKNHTFTDTMAIEKPKKKRGDS